MTERPILFSGPMVRAIIEGRKTQTRRVVKGVALDALAPDMFTPEFVACRENSYCQHGNVGDRLWVKETFRDPDTLEYLLYKADENTGEWPDCINPSNLRWKPSIFMPRRYSRITLEITDVRVQRLQEISEEDAQCEGVEPAGEEGVYKCHHGTCVGAQSAFKCLWDSINAQRGFGWDVNPWVWAISFKYAEQAQ